MQKQTYLNSNLRKGILVRWPRQCFPLPVYIAPCSWYSLSSTERNKYTGMVIDAFNTWESVSNGKFSFRLVNKLNDSLINIEWRRVDIKSLGNCNFVFDNESRLYSAEVQIGISDGIIHRQYMDENEVFHTILHEIGHAIGLGHSDNKNDIMYTPHQYGVVKLSQRDINSAKWLYELPYGSSAKSLSDAYGINCDNIDDIILYLSEGKKESKFQKLLKTPQKPSRKLEEDQEKLAQMKKFQMSIQNITLPKDIADKFKKF